MTGQRQRRGIAIQFWLDVHSETERKDWVRRMVELANTLMMVMPHHVQTYTTMVDIPEGYKLTEPYQELPVSTPEHRSEAEGCPND